MSGVAKKADKPELALSEPFRCLCPRLLLQQRVPVQALDPCWLCTAAPLSNLATVPWTRSTAGKQHRSMEKESSMSCNAVPTKLYLLSKSAVPGLDQLHAEWFG